MPIDRMLNAVQYRMVEEALVEKEVYDAMVSMRAKIDRLVGLPSDADTGSGAAAGGGGRGGRAPELPDLPVGNPTPQMQRGRVGRLIPRDAGAAADGGAVDGATDSGVPTDVLAAGDPGRDPAQRVAPFIPPTTGSGNLDDPFPQLGAKGKPLG